MVNLMGDNRVSEIQIGERISLIDSHGTVKYVGEVPPTKGRWLGIDWDDPARGKHNGNYEGVQYFTTRRPTSGSFIRPEKATTGRMCIAAIEERYGSQDLCLSEEERQSLQKFMNAALLEMVGFDKVNQEQSCFENLSVVCVRDHNVSHAGEPNQLANMCPNIRELDLSRNLLSSWESVASITRQLLHLRIIDISDNRLRIPDDPESLKDAFSTLTDVVLARMDYTWEQIVCCAKMWPNIKNLMVPFNNITELSMPSNMFSNLKCLDLEGNVINHWQEINKLGELQALESLNMCTVGVKSISLPADGSLFPHLKNLLLSENMISKWTDVSELDKLKSLEELRFTQNPVLQGYSKESSRQIVIARIGRLQVLNRVEVTRSERQQADYDYIKNNGQAWADCQGSEEQRLTFLSQHPQYALLIKKYGAAEVSEFEVKPASLNSKLMTIILCSNDKCIEKKIPKSMMVNRLVSLAQRLFNTGQTSPTLVYHSTKNPDIEVEMDNLLKPLDFYSVEEGDRIIVTW